MADSINLSELSRGWTPPDALRRSCPREVSLTRSGIFLYVICTAFVLGGLAAGIALYADGVRQTGDAQRLSREGAVTQADVTRLWITGGKSRQYRAAYRFTFDGQIHNSSASLRQTVWKKLRVGSHLDVRYVPDKPSIHYLVVNGPRRTPLWLPFVVGAPLVLAGLLLPLKVRRQKQLLADGRPAPGVVTRYRRTYGQHGQTQTWMYYEFAPSGGSPRKGRASVGRARAPEGSLICVLYDPDNPRRNAPYPMCSVKLATS